ncbi:CubicO group peptidase (beta-lactamase class C family) [Variovorax boronicumulans]|uniref:serine hydrolase domain-containing protein n=1 Tax=Variovorax boronicumulans TaxID=436515 RepID=UPI002781D5EA|nr:serine hydrolase [Variovorax boronicumulans]MDQ0013946.1 CubicO group peptidase (beta-lactamase class C family) [Variovorax boronicumulans]
MRVHRKPPSSLARFATALLFAALPLKAALAAPADEPAAWPTAGWTASTPEAQGMDSAALAKLVERGEANGLDSILITRHGKVVAEAYYAPYRAGLKHTVNSVTKAVVGTLTGMAIQDGLLASRDQPVLAFFPERTVANADAAKKSITLGHLLDQTSGLDWKEKLDAGVPESLIQLRRSRDWQGFVLDRPMAQAPGAGFNYNSGNSHLLSAIVAKKTGGSTLAYAQKRLFEPLGIGDVRWTRDPQGIEAGGFGLYLQPRDMAKIGYLYLRKGQWAGRQLLPADWVEQVFKASVDMGFGAAPAFSYANGWWTIPEKRAYIAAGYNRQLIVVLPEVDVVAVTTSRRNFRLPPFIDMVTAAVRSAGPLPADTAAEAQLADRIRDAAVEKPSAVGPTPELAAAISGKVWQFDRNALGVSRLVLDLKAATPSYEIVFDRGDEGATGAAVQPFTGPLGLDGLYRVNGKAPNAPVAVKGSWVDAQSFRIDSRVLGEDEVTMYTLRFDGQRVNVAFENNRGFKTQMQGRAAQ